MPRALAAMSGAILLALAPIPTATPAAATVAIAGCVRDGSHGPHVPPPRPSVAAGEPCGWAHPVRSHPREDDHHEAQERRWHTDRHALQPLPALLVLVVASAIAPVLQRLFRTRRRRIASALLRAEIARQAPSLRVRRMQLLVPDGAGAVRRERWEREKSRFCERRLRPVLARRGLDRLWPALQPAALRWIELTARRGRGRRAGFDPGMHPLEYERFCARELERAGWRTRLTPASGDQGADILATRRGVKLVVQCKLYRGAVGNDAVQQVAAARAHQAAQVAIVVSNARFTASALALARSNRVALLHHEELAGYAPERAPSDTIASATW